MRYVGDIIIPVRKRTANLELTLGSSSSVIEDVTEGIGDQSILEYLNDAQDHLQAIIVNSFPKEFVASKTISVVANQEEYTIPDNVFVNNRLITVKYSPTGNARDYYRLPPQPLSRRNTDTNTDPSFYIRRNGKILLNPIPTNASATIRPEYYRELDNLQVRAGQVTARTLSATQLTALTISTSSDLPNLISNSSDKYLCVCDADGVVKMYNVPYTSYASGTGVFTLNAFTFASGETVAVGDYITIGKYTTTHSALPNNCERYLKVYAQLRMLQTDSSQDWKDEASELSRIESDILDSFGDTDEDVHDFPVLDDDILF